METKHTPGPWGIVQVGDKIVRYALHHRMESLLTIVNEGGVAFAAVLEEADARLIAAAPELLEACEKVYARLLDLKPQGFGDEAFNDLEWAISKAKGEA